MRLSVETSRRDLSSKATILVVVNVVLSGWWRRKSARKINVSAGMCYVFLGFYGGTLQALPCVVQVIAASELNSPPPLVRVLAHIICTRKCVQKMPRQAIEPPSHRGGLSYFVFLFPSPFSCSCSLHGRNSDPGSPSRLFSPPPPDYGACRAF